MKKMKMLIAMLIAAMLIVGCSSPAKVYQKGSYTGEAQGFGGAVVVEIEVSEDKILSAKVTADGETPTIGGAAAETLADAIVEAQSAEVDVVAGATLTSNAVKEAAQKAISAAKGEEVETVSLTPGTYTATQQGHQLRHVTVSVTVDEKSIVDVQIVECTDNPITVVQTPCEEIPAAIVENQTYNVDVVTGATITSNAIKFAVKDCLDQAGGSAAFSAPVEKTEITTGEDVHTDILIVGGGGAGMSAAVEAYSGETANDANGLDVILIEKAGFLGGTTSVSGGAYYDYTDETGAYDDAWLDKVVASEKAIFEPFMNLEINEPLVRSLATVMQQANTKLREAGVNAPSGAWGISLSPCDDHKEPEWNGSYLAYAMNKYLPTTGIDVRLNTRAMKILTDESGAAIGVNVQDKTSTYNIYAKKIILACGDFASNPEMIEKYAPGFEAGLIFGAGTNTGDGLNMALEVGAVALGDTMMGSLGHDAVVGIHPDYGTFLDYGSGRSMIVNVEGNRFFNEVGRWYEPYHRLLKQSEPVAWGIIDNNNPKVQVLLDSTLDGIYHADTLEELADMIGVPADNLLATVEKYNGFIKDGEDKDFGTPVDQMMPIEEGPYHAFILRPITMTSLVGVKVDGECRLVRADGSVIENLFGAGNMIYGGNLVSYYVPAHGVGTAIYSGNLAAQTAKAEILGQ
ncbi:MAG: FAD-binding protein [Erysipelotrichaceae bacterium]|nr:FAD-binding protein [Erysipelotrichaceae bacterium]